MLALSYGRRFLLKDKLSFSRESEGFVGHDRDLY
jgi:hypothetical protein